MEKQSTNMSKLNEDKVENKVVIDFGQLRDPDLRESFLAAFGSMVKRLLGSIFGNRKPIITTVRGEPKEIRAFAQALKDEGRYISYIQKHGLDHPATHKNKAKLKASVKKFERDTGVTWPFEV